MTGLGSSAGAARVGTTNVGEVGLTGHPEVDAILASLDAVATLCPAEHVVRYTEAHRALADTLRTIDAV